MLHFSKSVLTKKQTQLNLGVHLYHILISGRTSPLKGWVWPPFEILPRPLLVKLTPHTKNYTSLMMYVFKSERHLQQKTFVVWHLFNSQSISLYNATYISSSVEDICTCSCRLHMNVIMNFVSTLSWIARYLEFLKVVCAACIVKRGKDAFVSALEESPYRLSRFDGVTEQYVIRLVLPHGACFRITITHTSASTSALPDNDKNDCHYNDHARPQRSRHERVRSVTRVIGASTGVKPRYSMAHMRQEYRCS